MEKPQPTSISLTWERLSAVIKTRFPLAKSKGNVLRFVFAMENDDARIGIHLASFMCHGLPSIAVAADLGFASQVKAWDALQLNSNLAIGALAFAQEVLVLRATVHLSNMDEDAALLFIQNVATEAMQIKRRLKLALDLSDKSDFNHYAE